MARIILSNQAPPLRRVAGTAVLAAGLVLAATLLASAAHAAGSNPPRMTRQGDRVRISNSHYAIDLDVGDGLGWAGIANLAVPASAGRAMLPPGGRARLFEVAIHVPGHAEPVRLDSRQFRVREVRLAPGGRTCEVHLRTERAGAPLDAVLTIQANETCQTLWRLALRASDPVTVDLTFPILENIVLGEHVEDIGYFFPRDPGLINDVPIRLLTCYGQYATSQLVSVFNDRWGPEGGGLYYIWEDTSLHRKSFELTKLDPEGAAPLELLDRYGFPFWEGLRVQRGVGVASHLPHIALPTGVTVTLAPLALGVHGGNWRQAFADYQSWARTWYLPRHPPKLARYFTFASYHAYQKCPFWAPDTAEAAIAGIPEQVDQLHFIAQKEDRYGVYDKYREDWGLEGLRRFVAAAHARGKLCSHYVQGTVAHETSAVYQEHGAEWGQKNPDGTNVTAWANQCMCLASIGWADWLAATSSRLVRDLDLDIVYLDCVGWTTLEKFQCHSPRHPHQPPWHELADVRRLLHTVKTAIVKQKPDVALTTEGPLSDLFLNDVDGNEGYGINFMYTRGYGAPIHFMRFLYPRFKYLDLLTDTPERVKLALFNATATAADPARMPEASLAHRVFHENVTAFTQGDAEPDLPTREAGVYCNRFTTPGKTVYTLWNHNEYPAAGAFVPVRLPPGSHVVDLLHHREAQARRVDRREHLVVALEAKDVGVFAVVPRGLSAKFDGMWLQPDWRALPAGAELVAASVDEADHLLKAAVVGRERETLDFVQLSDRGAYRVVLRLMRAGEVVDELELPRLEGVDIAEGAAVTASNRQVEGGAHPESVVGQDGHWQFAWNDEPRPGWLQLAWKRPQTFNHVALTFAQAEYSSRDCEVLVSDEGASWRSVARGSSDEVAAKAWAPTTARWLRVVFHQGGPWANLVSLTRLKVQYLLASRP